MCYISVPDRKAWRSWLENNHASQDEVWLAYYKKHTGKASVTYMDSVKEALCFGWIDGLKKRIDDDRYAHRFTPRKANSKWSPQNIRLAEELIGAGEMTEAGLVAFDQRVPYDEELQKRLAAKGAPVDDGNGDGLKSQPKSLGKFQPANTRLPQAVCCLAAKCKKTGNQEESVWQRLSACLKQIRNWG